MSNKRKLSTILGVAGATILAAGGSIFLTDTGLSLVDNSTANVRETEGAHVEKETEQPVTVEKFAKTKDSFSISAKKNSSSGNSANTANGADTANSAGENAMYATGNVYIRVGAGSDSDVLGTLGVGDSIEITGNTVDGWVEVSYNGQTGYIYGDYLSKDRTSSTGSSSSGNGSTDSTGDSSSGSSGSGSTGSGSSSGSSAGSMYATGNVNVRAGASKDSDVLGTLTVGESVSVTGNSVDGWTEVNYDGQTGYVSGNYLSYDQPDTSGGSSSGSSSGEGSGSWGGSSSGGSGNSYAWDDSYMMYDIDSRYISADELSGWSANDLATLRNEIFARHGRIFTKQQWIDYFSQKTWYVPTYDPSYFDSNMDSFLNDYEWANLKVILKLEG